MDNSTEIQNGRGIERGKEMGRKDIYIYICCSSKTISGPRFVCLFYFAQLYSVFLLCLKSQRVCRPSCIVFSCYAYNHRECVGVPK